MLPLVGSTKHALRNLGPGLEQWVLKEDVRKLVVCVLAGNAALTHFGYVLVDDEDEQLAESVFWNVTS